MKTLTIANLKTHFSDIINDVKNGEEIVIEFGKKHEKVAVIIPYKKFKNKKRKIGILKGKASYEIVGDFKMSAKELFNL